MLKGLNSFLIFNHLVIKIRVSLEKKKGIRTLLKLTNISNQIQPDNEQQSLREAQELLVSCSEYFCRKTPVPEKLICTAIPDFMLLKEYYKTAGILKQSTKIQTLFKQVEACNFFDYFDIYTFSIFEKVLPANIAKSVASELTMMLIEVYESSVDSPEYYRLISSRCVLVNHFVVLVHPRGHTAVFLGETLAMICQLAISKIAPRISHEGYEVES